MGIETAGCGGIAMFRAQISWINCHSQMLGVLKDKQQGMTGPCIGSNEIHIFVKLC